MTTRARDARWNLKIREQRRQQRKRRSHRLMGRAREMHAELCKVLGGKCEKCGDNGTYAPLSIDHVDGITWSHRQYNLWYRVRKYWDEYKAGVRLRVLCVPCNSSRGRPAEAVPF